MAGIFRSLGELQLPTVPEDMVPMPVSGLPVVGEVMMVLFILLALLLVGNFIDIIPHLADSILRARGSTALEGSVRVSRDRNIIALVFVIPAIVIMYRYCLYYPDFVKDMPPNTRLWTTMGIFVGYLLLRYLLFIWLKPRRSDAYYMSYKAGYSFFILLCLVAFLTLGILALFHAGDRTVRTFMLVEVILFYAVYFFRRGQILSTNCNPFATFLYLCALEILPTGLFVASALVF
ncbi:MAG: hypothetical protein J5769_05535 [Bacteroidales bacterium]|nr:hypothetical protein [Bacteroidales bacterium]